MSKNSYHCRTAMSSVLRAVLSFALLAIAPMLSAEETAVQPTLDNLVPLEGAKMSMA